MQPGTKPKPTKLKLLEGVTRKDRINLDEPIPPPIALECPDWLSDNAKTEWARMEDLGMVTEVDMAALACMCQVYANLKIAQEFLNKHGTTFQIAKKDKKGNIISLYIAPFPQVVIVNQSLNQMRAFCAEFGLTPSSRGRISLPAESPDEDNLENMFRLKKAK